MYPKIAGIILMSGQGNRFGSQLPKQFHRIAGKKVYLYTVEQFLKVPSFDTILLVCPKDWLTAVQDEIVPYKDSRLNVIAGGATRQESSYLALQACREDTQYVVIHDGVRPFVSQEILLNNIQGAIAHGAVDTCIPSADTIVHAATDQIQGIPLRSEYWRGQTPQSFHYPLILQAHRDARKNKTAPSSDDCSLVVRSGHPVKIVLGSEENIKITTELDLFLAEQILRLNSIHLEPLNQSLAGKKIAVTGGTGGIGQAIALALQEAGAIPIPISRTTAPYRADFTSPHDARAVFEKVEQDHGLLDGLINCFGLLQIKEISSQSSGEIEQLIAANFTGIVYSCKWAPVRSGGHIINIASSSYARGKKGYAVYAGAKAAVVNFTQGLAEERSELCINAVIPQRTNTRMRQDNFPGEDPSDLIEPEEIAATILSLLQKKEFTGSIIEVRKKFNKSP